MSIRLTALALGICAVTALVPAAGRPKSKHVRHSGSSYVTSGAENGLIGIKLYDAGARVVGVYGTPDEIQPIQIGTSQIGGRGGSGGGPGYGGPPAGMFPGGAGGRAPGGPGAGAGGADENNPFSFADGLLQGGPPMGYPGGGAGGPSGRGMPPAGYGGPGGSGGGSYPGAPGYGGPGGGMPGRGGMPGSPISGGGNAEHVTYTRWVYNRAGSKYGFIIDKFGHVVQIEAIGIENNKVRTRRGVGFGATFAELIKRYGNPDGYEITGDNVLVRYLTRQKVAFRLSRLGVKKPQVVTGIVVAAAKA